MDSLVERLADLTGPAREAETTRFVLERIMGNRENEPCDFSDLARELKVPYVAFMKWLQSDGQRWEAVLKAWEVRAIRYVQEAVDIADGKKPVAGVDPSVMRDKIRVEARFRYARYHAPKLYGETVQETPRGGFLEIRLKRDPGTVVDAEVVK